MTNTTREEKEKEEEEKEKGGITAFVVKSSLDTADIT